MIQNMNRTFIEPGLLRIFRYFTGIAMIYYALVISYTALQTGSGAVPQQVLLYVNFATNLILSGYLSWRWLERRLERWYLPLGLMIATIVPIFSNLIYFVDPAANLSESITRNWIILPILLVPLVLIAWQYRFRYVLLFVLFTAAIQLFILLPVASPITFETLPYLGIPIVQAFAFGVVGHIVTRLMEIQRNQRRQLIQANMQLAQHANTLEQLAISRERNRLARELHDTLAHTLSGLTVNLEALKITLDDDPREAHILVDHALKNTRTGLTETRRALKALRAQHLEDLGVELAITNLADNAASRVGFELDLQIAPQLPDLTPDVEQCIYRITQESLENIIQHANATKVRIQLQTHLSKLELSIQDDGDGFDPADVDSTQKLGLQGMSERATAVGGIFEVSSQPKAGTLIRLIVENPLWSKS
jgi:signal transduction histidine kinase